MPEASDFDAFCRLFSTEQSCAKALFRLRWPEGFRCPQCGHSRFYLIRTRHLPLFECAACHRQTSVTAGTIMEGSRTPLVRWFQAIRLMAAPGGISSMKLSKILQVTYKTAWLMSHKIRYAMQKADQFRLLNGIVQISYAWYGYRLFRDARQPLLIGASLSSRPNLHYVKIKQPSPQHVDNERRFILHPGVEAFLQTHVKKEAKAVLLRYIDCPSDLKSISRNASGWLNDTFCGIGAKHLQAYLDEFCFRLNAQLQSKSALDALLRQCAITGTITYKTLTRPRPVLPVPWIRWGGRNKWRGRHLSLCSSF